jgi:hypothetical protein
MACFYGARDLRALGLISLTSDVDRMLKSGGHIQVPSLKSDFKKLIKEYSSTLEFR